jgi:transcriptional regulator with XRE-family HTH domain
MTRKTLSQYAYAKNKGVSRQYISRLVQEGRIVLISGKVDPEQADAVLDETWSPRRKNSAIRKLIETALYNFAWFAGQNGFDANEVDRVAEIYIKGDQLNKHLKKFGHPGLDSYEVQLNGEWGHPDWDEILRNVGDRGTKTKKKLV